MTDVVVVSAITGSTVVVNPPIGSTSASTVVDVNAASVGPQGPTGATGATGATGPTGLSGGSYVHTQSSPASTWSVSHNLGYYPNIVVVDSSGTQVEGSTTWTSTNALTITFSNAFSGVAYLS